MKTLLAFVAAALLAGCASTPELESKAGVEDRTPTTAVPAQPGVTAVTPIAPKADQLPNALKDPKNILSKRSIFYDYDKYDVKDEYKPLLQAHAHYLAQNRSAKMLIQGNADERGSREYNIALGQKRAEGVRKMLQLMGAQESQIEAVSLGEEKPRCTENTEACYSQNRRSDMLYGGEY
ncbi:MAG: peptidoglycan-associated lipoprotein [Betaproteobacteria bacterium RIFCSPLOWO2_12_FULL_64_23]|nr:MAG: peptidoglycan-associated lipoprotein [Betaproteobacteria bacterium RIFCSPLOWO2_12_FULL_64_23]